MSNVTRPPPAPEWVTVSAYAARFGVDRSTVYKWLGAGLLETYRQDTLLRIRNVPIDQHHPDPPASAAVDGRKS